MRKRKNLQKTRSKSKSPAAPSAPSATVLSLDDVAAQMVQVEANDLPGLARLHGMLSELPANLSLPAPVSDLVLRSAQMIHDVILEDTTDKVAALADASRFLEAAIEARDDPTKGESQNKQPEMKAAIKPVPSIPAPEGQKNEQPAPVLATSAPCPVSVPEEGPVPEILPPDADRELIVCFVTESREYLESAEASLLQLETDPDNLEAVNTVFRAFHTLKGTSGFLGLKHINVLAHRAESLLSRIRDREIRCTGGYADLALRSADLLGELVQTVHKVLGGEPLSKPAGYDELMRVLADPEAAGVSGDPSEATLPHLRVGDILVAAGKASREDVESAAASQGSSNIGEALLKSQVSSATDLAQALRTQRRVDGTDRTTDSTVRVRTDRLDRLIDMVGELVIAQSMVAQDETVHQGSHHGLLRKVAHSGKIVRELQDLSMFMRMVPLKATFQKMNRLVRDLAHKSGKLVEFHTEGEDTEIDRNMVDVIADPLVHMIRNAIDHGIEAPEVREQSGKIKTGKVRLSAYHAGGNVIVELADDGKGLDREKILKKALEKGLLSPDKTLSESEIFSLIFAPGFSTADQITDVSGRGVGMDVVRRNVEALRGRIDIASQSGRGSTFTIRLPLTLAITDGMLVRVGTERYIIPTVNIHLSFRPEASALSTIAGRGELVMLRGELMPLFRLHRLFHIPGAVEEPTQGLLVVVGDGERRCSVLVDELLGQQQVVAKSLGEGLGKIPGVSGGAILGDGRVGLILDPGEVVAQARQTTAAASSRQAAGELVA